MTERVKGTNLISKHCLEHLVPNLKVNAAIITSAEHLLLLERRKETYQVNYDKFN